MLRAIQMFVFLVVFISLFFGVNYYVFSRFSFYFDLKRDLLFYGLLFLASFSYILFTMIERAFHSYVTRFLYFVASQWMGFLLLFFSVFLIFEVLRMYTAIPNFVLGMSVVIIVLLLGTYGTINAKCLHTKIIEIPANIKEARTIVHLSDIHLGAINQDYFMRNLAKQVDKTNPNVILITGDLFDGSINGLSAETLAPLENLNVPIYMSAGNHEIYTGIEKTHSIIDKTKINYLRDEANIEFDGLRIIGIDDSEDRYRVRNVLSKMNLDSKKFNILMYHRPIGFSDAASLGVDLMLSGHTHNGQIIPFNLLVKMQFKHIMGLYKDGNSHLYVNPGTGTWGPYMRIGSKSEITVIKLIPN